jgi:predicted RecB family endonuclease
MAKAKVCGDHFEIQVSSLLHPKTTPILISPLLLRQRGLGQVDIAYLKEGAAYAAECKSGAGKVSSRQMKRLSSTAAFIGFILCKRVRLIGIQQVAKLNAGDYPFRVCNIRELM